MGRRQGQQEMLDAGILVNDIERWCKYVYDEMTSSYVLNLPLAPMLQRCGYDPFHKRDMFAAHLSVDVSHLIAILLPRLVALEQEVIQALYECQSFEQACHQRLYLANGCYSSMRFILETFLQCSAARPRDAHYHIIAAAPPLYLQFKNDNPLFQKDIFRSPAFLKVVQLVHEAEDREIERMRHLPPGYHVPSPSHKCPFPVPHIHHPRAHLPYHMFISSSSSSS